MKVLYAVPPDNLENEKNQTMYMITVCEGKEKGVTGLDIHKFLKSYPIPKCRTMKTQYSYQNAAEAKKVVIGADIELERSRVIHQP